MPQQQRNPWLAVNPTGDRLAQAQALQRVHQAFHAGRDVGRHVRAVVAQSWARSGEAGVDPSQRAPIVMEEREIEERWSRHPLYPVLPVLRDLLSSATNESAHMLVISDARGVLLWIEGHHRVVDATHDMHLVCGADWSERSAGTNALGTALAVDHPVQIFSAEHVSRAVHPWQCSGAPIHDPATGEILGVIDLTGHLRTAHPHTLSLVTAAAGMAEAYLRHEQARRDERTREAYLERVAGARERTALVRASGQVLMAVPTGWLPSGGAMAAGERVLEDGSVADVEPLHDCFVLWQRRTPAAREVHGALRLELLGRRPTLQRPGESVRLSGRHAEILAVLLLAGRGLTVEELTREIYAEDGKPVTLRAEMSRLRAALPGVLATRPYRFALPVTSDLGDAERLLADGRAGDALALARERLLPDSTAPRVVAARERFEAALAAAAAADPALHAAWRRTAAGER